MNTSLRPSLILSLADNPVALNLVLEALSLQTRPPAELLIVDDGSDDQTTALIERWSARLPFPIRRFWQPHFEFKKTAALNRAVRAASGNYLIFLEGDCLPHRRFIADHCRHAARGCFVQGRRAGIRARYIRDLSPRRLQPFVLFAQGRLYHLRRAVRRPFASVSKNERHAIRGCNFAVWREDFFRVNGFDESFVGWGHEEAELALRLRHAGLVAKTVFGQAIVYHLDHPRIARYRMNVNERILEQTRRERRIRCEHGVADEPLAAEI